MEMKKITIEFTMEEFTHLRNLLSLGILRSHETMREGTEMEEFGSKLIEVHESMEASERTY